MINNNLKNKISRALSRNQEILAAYVFGSYASGKYTKESDFDLAVLIKNRNNIDDKQVYLLLSEISFPKDLDLSVVDKNSSPLFLFQIISKGECVYTKSKDIQVQFEAFTMRNYYDNAHIRMIYKSYLKNKFA